MVRALDARAKFAFRGVAELFASNVMVTAPGPVPDALLK
jgi:hypothetical protein